jgi:hypothetical protein
MRSESSNSGEPIQRIANQSSRPVQEEVGSASLNRCLIGVDLADKGRAGRRRGEALAVSALVQVCIVTLR